LGSASKRLGELERARLVPPAPCHAPSYLEALREGFRRGEQDTVTERRVRQIEADFAGYLAVITDQTRNIRLPTGEIVPKVPFSLHWLTDGDVFIGEASLRHQLNAHLMREGGHIGYGIRPSYRGRGYGRRILALALAECRTLGLERVLVTCLESNAASARIIEVNGGVLENVIVDPAGRGRVCRYWIEVGAQRLDG
jgi:predicted acetyltransferase